MARLSIDHLFAPALAAGLALAAHAGCAADGTEEAEQAEVRIRRRVPGRATTGPATTDAPRW